MNHYGFRSLAAAALLAMTMLAAQGYADTVIKGVKPGFKSTDPAGVVEYHTGLLTRPKGVAEAEATGKLLDLQDDPACANMPANFSLVTDVTPSPITFVKNQGSCGSCWSFSKTGAFESWLISMGKATAGTLNLSEQELVSNDGNNYGCDGGLLNRTEYQFSQGQGVETDFPYTSGSTGRTGNGKRIPAFAKIEAPQYQVIAGSGAAKLKNAQCALWKYHTAAWITLGADNDWGNPPTDGSLWKRCSNNQTNHAINFTGWKTFADGQVGLEVKNSWGTGWGKAGYAYIPLGCDSLGDEIAFLPATPTPPNPTPTPTPSPTPDPTPVPGPKCQPEVSSLSAAFESLKACLAK